MLVLMLLLFQLFSFKIAFFLYVEKNSTKQNKNYVKITVVNFRIEKNRNIVKNGIKKQKIRIATITAIHTRIEVHTYKMQMRIVSKQVYQIQLQHFKRYSRAYNQY